MRWTTFPTLTAAALTLALAGCGDDEPASTPAGATTFPEAGEVLFADELDDDTHEWGEVRDGAFGPIFFEDGDLVAESTGRVVNWGAGDLIDQYFDDGADRRDVIVESEMTIVSGGGVAGVACRTNPEDDDSGSQWYDFVVRDGYAAIRHSDDESNIEVLAETEDLALPLGEPFLLKAACIDSAEGAELSLGIDGELVLTHTDATPLGNGWPSVVLWTFPVHERLDVRWHSFTVSAPA